ncbi:MAG: MlaE family lipid ABC transporter permease subunit [Legionellales bacterium]|nr:MlaE family lipid ABC transporter permease subunit [Legionellales bacterium]
MPQQSPTHPSSTTLFHWNDTRDTLYLTGRWCIQTIDQVEQAICDQAALSTIKTVCVDASSLEALDTAGALLLVKLVHWFTNHDKTVKVQGLSEAAKELYELVMQQTADLTDVRQVGKPFHWLHALGRETCAKLSQVDGVIVMMGEVMLNVFHALRHPRRFRAASIASTIELSGFHALPIVALLSFLIGIVLAYQLGVQLKLYGADVFVVDLSGIAILREFAPLITAIIIAGRTSSSFTAQLGLMKANEEIDAMYTMGLSPIEHLVSPRVIGLIIALPLLTLWSDVFGVLGSMLMTKGMFDIGYYDFLLRFQQNVPMKNYFMGMVKAPVFALLIAIVGCYQGFQVSGSAESVGRKTTQSVVQAIFLIIVADALFSIFYSWAEI